LSNPEWLAITLAIAFEIGAAATLGAIVILDRTSRWLIWSLFILITGMQMMGNMYYAYVHLENFQGWVELFGLEEEDLIYQKRILSLVSGAILPVVALGFIKSLVDYIRPSKPEDEPIIEDTPEDNPLKEESKRVWETVDRLRDEGKLPPLPTEEELEDEPTALANSGYRERAELEQSNDSVNDVIEEIKESERDPHNPIKNKNVEEKIAKVIANNPELKNMLKEEIKKLEIEDKYTKPDSPISSINSEKRTFGGM
jgi:hypothetical protein